jgi:putative transposase
MPSKRKQSEGTPSVAELKVPAEFLDQLVKGSMTQGEVEAVCRSLKKAVIERAMGAEPSQRLGYAPGEAKPAEQRRPPAFRSRLIWSFPAL